MWTWFEKHELQPTFWLMSSTADVLDLSKGVVTKSFGFMMALFMITSKLVVVLHECWINFVSLNFSVQTIHNETVASVHRNWMTKIVSSFTSFPLENANKTNKPGVEDRAILSPLLTWTVLFTFVLVSLCNWLFWVTGTYLCAYVHCDFSSNSETFK